MSVLLEILRICPDKHSGEGTAGLFSLSSSCWSTSVKVLRSSWMFPPVWSLPFLTSCHLSLALKWLISDHSHLQIITANIINLVDLCSMFSSSFSTAEPVLLSSITLSWHDLQTPWEGTRMFYWSPVNAWKEESDRILSVWYFKCKRGNWEIENCNWIYVYLSL